MNPMNMKLTHLERFTLVVTMIAWLVYMIAPAVAGETKGQRIVAIGGSVTEIIFALGEQDRLVGRDTTSNYPREAFGIPDVGYIRAISPEGVLSVNPDLIIAMEGYGPREAKSVIDSAGVPIAIIPEGFDGDAVIEKIMAVGRALGVDEKAKSLAADVSTQMDALSILTSGISEAKNVLFVMSLREGRIMAGGDDTHADGIIRMAGANNVMKSIMGYKPVSNEAVITSAPDMILMMDRGGDHSVKDEELFGHPAISQTPAGKNRRVIRMDGMYILGFGPRTANAATDLAKLLYGEQVTSSN